MQLDFNFLQIYANFLPDFSTNKFRNSSFSSLQIKPNEPSAR